jgi:long-chain acyl-CoA synthetase
MMELDRQTPIDRLLYWARTTPARTCLHQPIDRTWTSWTWAQTLDQASRMAAALKARDLPHGSHIAILSRNCAHWIFADLAIMLAGHVSVPLFQNQASDQLDRVLEHSGCALAFVGKLDEPARIAAALPVGLPRICFPYPGAIEGESWNDLIASHAPVALTEPPALDDVATIIYTSGTTGEPKGAVFRFRQIAWAQSRFQAFAHPGDDEHLFSYLPLSHCAERWVVEMSCLYIGAQISFAESAQFFADDVRRVQPTRFFAVPRLWTAFQNSILESIPQRKLDRLLRIPVMSSIIKRKVRERLGLSRARAVYCGAATVSPSLLDWYSRLGIHLQEYFGATETFGYGCGTPDDDIRFGYVGRPLPDTDMKTGPGGELLIRCGSMMDGYYRDPQRTAEAIDHEGYYRTGDLGEIGPDGYVRILGRVREQFKTAKGKFVSPALIEGRLMENYAIEQICLCGAGLPHNVAVAVLSQRTREQGRDTLEASLLDTVKRVNESLENHERIVKFVVVDDLWTIDNGLLTPTLKIKRHVIEARYGHLVEEALDHADPVWWVPAAVTQTSPSMAGMAMR